MEINKIAGALLSAVLIVTVISFIGDALVNPLQKKAASVRTSAPPAASATAKPEKDPPIAQLLASAKVASGKKAFKKCKSCHNAAKGAKNKIGPNLWDIVGNKKAGVAGFKYSGALTGLGGNWSYEDLNAFL
ncbi:MAG: c-type cytochrome, partial [Alphaproteobacteria bacterium]